MKKLVPLLVLLLVIIGGGYFYWQQTKTQELDLPPTKIGVLAPLSGDVSNFGFGIKRGIELAITDLEATQVELVFEDSGCQADTATAAFEKLLDQNVVAIIGEVCSGATLAVAPLANAAEIVLISPASTSPDISQTGPYIFRTVPSDALQGQFAAEMIYDQGLKKLAILYTDEAYGQGLNQSLSESFKALGGEITTSETIDRSVTNVENQAGRILQTNPEAIYLIANSPLSASATLQAFANQDTTVPIFASEAFKDQQLVEDIPDAVENVRITAVSSGTRQFQQRHRVVHETDPGPFAAQAYDATKALILALEASSQEGMTLKDALRQTEFEGVSGPINFDINGDVEASYEVFTVNEGAFIPEE